MYMMRAERAGVILLLFLTLPLLAHGASAAGPTVVLYAFDAEGALLESRMAIDSVTAELGRRVVHGTLAARAVILAEAGVGMTNAAMTVQHLIDAYGPSSVLFSGIAGGIDSTVRIGDIVVCSSWVHHEFGYWGKDGLRLEGPEIRRPGEDSLVSVMSLPVDTGLLGIARMVAEDSLRLEPIGGRIPRLTVGGTGVSGNSFIDNVEKRVQLSRDLHALVVDMESAAVVQTCLVNGVRCLVFRSASDLAGGSGSETARGQIKEFFKVAAANSSEVVMAFLQKL